MKIIIILFLLILSIYNCSSFKELNTSNITKAQSLLSTLNANTSIKQISNLFTLLDINKDGTLGITEVIGIVEDQFKVLDTDKNASLNLTELESILNLL